MATERTERKQTVHRGEKRRWAVLGSRARFWKSAAGWSVVLFALSVGTAALGWTFIVGGDPSASHDSMIALLRDRLGGGVKEVVVEEMNEPVLPYRRVLDGVRVAEEPEEIGYIGVMYDNISDARPLAGIADAPLVIEAPVEGGITRLLALFPENAEVSRIGPVRSARPYYVDWAEEYDALYVHVGGSKEALDMLRASDVSNIDEFSSGKYFFRDPNRYAPHATYTSTELLTVARERRYPNAVPTSLYSWAYKDDVPVEDLPVDVPDSTVEYENGYAATWEYDRAHNDYVRYQGGEMFIDETGRSVRARNVVVQYTEVRIIDRIGRRHIRTSGDGDALFICDGMTAEGSWLNDGGRTAFFTQDGEPFPFNAGTTWIEVVPLGTTLTQ